jgi:hypothetical protein
MKVTNGEKTIEVTEKAYRVVYAEKGFKPTDEAKDEGKKTSKREK